jgi:hypothetical protein
MATGHVVYITIGSEEAATKLTEMEAAMVDPEVVAILNNETQLLVKHREQPTRASG